MREIKFRAWDASEKEMVDWPHLLNDPDDWLQELLTDPGEDALMQFTGLKDKNGVEIFEGDIVSFKVAPRDENEQIISDKGIVSINEYCVALGCWSAHYCSDVVVHGNIYEHPHLLESGNGN